MPTNRATNGDAGADCDDAQVREWAAHGDNVTLVTDLPADVYQLALRHCTCYVGNSSSGVIEAPFYGTPVVLVGSRQDGRPRAQNVRDEPNPTAEILVRAIRAQVRHGPYPAGVSPWGDGRAAPRILAAR